MLRIIPQTSLIPIPCFSAMNKGSFAKYSDALEFRKKNRPVQYWIEDIINPERIECSSEDFIFIVRMLTSKLNLYVKEISNTLNN